MKTREDRLSDARRTRATSRILAEKTRERTVVKATVPTRNKPKTPKGDLKKNQLTRSTKEASARQHTAGQGKENSGLHTTAPRKVPAKGSKKPSKPQNSSRRATLADWSAAMESEFENLTGRLDSIKRESLRPAIKGEVNGALLQLGKAATRPADVSGSTARQAGRIPATQTEAPAGQQGGQVVSVPSGGQGLAECARELFHVPEFMQLCERGLNAQLQRTKDGATERSRIAELAGLVKTLRKALKEMQHKSTAFIDAGIRYEKEALAQVEGVKLASESATRQLEAEVANLRRGAAQAAAAHKQAMASWQIELDLQRAEASHARRELERLEAERDRARDEARRAEELRVEVESSAKGLKREAGQQLRDLQVDHGEAVRTLLEAQEAHARAEARLKETMADLQQSTADASTRAATLEAEASALREELWQRGEELAAVTRTKEQLQQDCEKLAAGLAEHEQLHREVAAQSSSSASEAALLQQRCATLAQQLASKEALVQTTVGRAEAQANAFAAELDAAQREVVAVKESLRQACACNEALTEENVKLTTALRTASSRAAEAEAALLREQSDVAALRIELEASRREREEANAAVKVGTDRIKALEVDLREAGARLEAEVEARRTLAAEASAKAARLARLEGEFEAMQEAIGTGSIDQAEMLGRLISRVATLEAAVAESHCARRELHNQLVNLRGNIRVFCRIKPHAVPALTSAPDGLSVKAEIDGKEQSFVFDKVFGAAATQREVFDEVSELVQSALDGYQVCLFSYGQTGAGKTHTMQGGRTSESQGIIPRAIVKILEEAAALREKGWEYHLEATFVEVYNESLRDLLAEGKGRDVGKLPEANVIKHHPGGGPSTVVGAVRTKISTAAEAAALVKRAAAARSVEATAMNAVSSRSHSVFMLYISGHHAGSSTHLLGGLNLVDLAGSERLDRSLAEGQRQKEACSINKSLSALGDVFSALSARNPHVPYRNSKLTHLLQPCLGGDGKTLMFVNVSPEAESLQETVCSLRFAAKVNACQTAARGGAKRHVSNSGDARISLQGVKRQSATAPVAKRKAPGVTVATSNAKRRLV